MINSKLYDDQFNTWILNEKLAVNLLNYSGQLMYDKGIEIVLFRQNILDIGVTELMRLFSYAENVVKRKIDIKTALELIKEINHLTLPPSKLDIGLLTAEYIEDSANSFKDFLEEKLSKIINSKNNFQPRDIVLFGFGRIGRLAARELIRQAGNGQQMRLKAIVVRNITDEQIIKRANLLRNDSVHGSFNGVVDIDIENKRIIINGQIIHLIEGSKPDEINYENYGIIDALLIDNTGAFTSRKALSCHLKSKGINKVLLTAPGTEIPNIVYGINNKDLDIENINIFSAASCTTNCIAPILQIIEDKYEIINGHLETVHSYTNDQNLLDNMHKKPRRGRSAAINMVITTTGAGKAVTKVIPSLEGKLTANAVRVPTANVSLAIMRLNIKNKTNIDEVNNLIREEAIGGNLINQINYQIDPDLVSTDIVGNPCCSVFDSQATIVTEDGQDIVLYVWYDNEFGYTKQVIRLAKQISKVRRLTYY
jgi:glyceraldehyde 3-phosphate dehydrogenase|tara:strand:- start:13448 stop:14890 length:1443 start_codon:yes stop_codon:yes gene_type:complete